MTTLNRIVGASAMTSISILAIAVSASAAAPLGTAFTYQGQLKQNGLPVSDTVNFEFSLWDEAGSGAPPTGGAQIGSTQTVNNVTVANGLFTVELDFGAGAFEGNERWLQIAVRSSAGGGAFTTLAPRQPISATPYAAHTRGLFVDDALNVGIGTTTPAGQFEVREPGTAQRMIYVPDGFGDFILTTEDNTIALQNVPFGNGSGAASQIQFYNGEGFGSATVGSASPGTGGFLNLSSDGLFTVRLHADRDNTLDDVANGFLEVKSFGPGGVGGEIAALNNDGNTTVSLLGGGSGSTGSLALFNTSGTALAELDEFDGSGRLTIFNGATGQSMLNLNEDTSPLGGGSLEVARNAAGDLGFFVHGNTANSQSTSVSIFGTSQSIVLDTNASGTSTAVLPVGAIDSNEIANEAGVAGGSATGPVVTTAGITTLDSRTITIPGPGYILAIATCTARAEHQTLSSNSLYEIGISDIANTLDANRAFTWFIPEQLPASNTYNMPVTVHALFQVNSFGPFTFYLNLRTFAGTEDFEAEEIQFSLVYLPTAYGTVVQSAQSALGAEAVRRPTMTAGDMAAERERSIRADLARREAELAETKSIMNELRSRVEKLEQRLDKPRRARPPVDPTVSRGEVRPVADRQE